MSRITIVVVVLVGLIGAPAAQAASDAPPPPSRSWSEGPIAHGSCGPCAIGLGIAARAAYGIAKKAASRQGAKVIRNAAARRGADRAAKPIIRTAQAVKRGGPPAALKVLLANVKNRAKVVEAVQDCFVNGTGAWLITKQAAESVKFRAAVGACTLAAFNTLRKP